MKSEEGLFSYIIAGQQENPGEPVNSRDDMIPRIFEPLNIPLSLKNKKISPKRLRDNSDAVEVVIIQEYVEGSIPIYVGVSHLGFWFKNLFSNLSPESEEVDGGDIIASGTSFTKGAAIIPDTQPFSLIDDPVNNGKLNFSFSGSSVDSGEIGKIIVKGRDQRRERVEEEITFSTVGTHESDISYRTIEEIVILNVSGGTFGVTCIPEVYKHILIPKNDLLAGATFETVKGGIPTTYGDLIFKDMMLSTQDIVTLAFGLIGRSAKEGESISGGSDPTDLTDFDNQKEFYAPDWGSVFSIDGEVYPFSDASVNINNMISIPQTKFHKGTVPPMPERNGHRVLGKKVGISYEDINFSDDIETELLVTIPSPKENHSSVGVKFPHAKITNPLDPGVQSEGEIIRNLSIEAYKKGSDPDVEITVISSESGSDFTDK